MSGSRDKAWYLIHDKGGQVAALEVRMDVLDWEISYERQRRHEETRDRLARLGYDVSNYKPLPPIGRAEQRCAAHLSEDDDIERIVADAKESALDRAYRQHLATRSGAVIRRNIGQVLALR